MVGHELAKLRVELGIGRLCGLSIHHRKYVRLSTKIVTLISSNIFLFPCKNGALYYFRNALI
jgi:hypothetical protein